MPFQPPTGNTQTGNALNLYQLAKGDSVLQPGDILQVTAQQTGNLSGAGFSGFLIVDFETFTITNPKNPAEQIPLPSGQYCITQMVFTNNNQDAQTRTYQQQTIVTWNAEQYALTKDRLSGPDVCLSGYGTQASLNAYQFTNSIVTANQQSSINGINYLTSYNTANTTYGPINHASAAISLEGIQLDTVAAYISQGCFTYLGPNNVAPLASFQIITPPYHR